MIFRYIALLLFSLTTLKVSAQRYQDMINAGTYTLEAIRQEAEAYFDQVGKDRGRGYKQYKRWEYVASLELDASGVKIPNFELAQRARDYRRYEQQRQAESGGLAGDWKQLGPTYWNATSSWNPGVGRVTSIGLDPKNHLHVIIGSPTGGVWKTLDGCNTWTPLTDEFSTVDVYALEISPYNSNEYLWGSTSGKIFRSTDGGASWAATSNVSGGGKVIRILYHPTDPNVVYAVSETNGLFRSVNSGISWTAVNGVSSVSGYDVEFKPGDPNTIYFSGKSFYRSTNGGNSFTEINDFLTDANKYKMIGVSPANPAVVYVLEANGGRFGAFYKSTNSGAAFTKLIDGADINYFGYSATGDDDRGQAPRDMDVAVSLSNAEEVHIAGIHTWKSVNGGASFELTSYWTPGTAASLGVGYNHADIDILKFAGDTLYVGSDGGIYISTNGAQTFVDRTSGLGIREFYKIGVSKTNPNVVSGGSQDNGTSVMRTNNRLWVDWLGADGMETFVDWNNANILYGTSQYGSMYKSTNQGNSRSGISKPPDVEDGAWVTPFEQDPQVPTTIYVAFADVWKSTNSGDSWTKISDFNNGNMSQMKLAPSDNQRIYVSRGSNLFTTANGGATWATATSGWGTNSISYIAVHPQNPQRVLIVTSSNIYQSMDAGVSWTNIGAGLPSGSKYCAAWENTGKNGIYVGGFGYISYTNDDLGGQWIGYMDGLPNVRVYELEINYISNTIFAGTYGRGLWESPLYQIAAPVAAFTANKRLGCREMSVAFTDQSSNSPKLWEWTFEGGTPAASSEQHPNIVYNQSGTFKVQLRVSNAGGENVYEAVDYITILLPAAPVASDVVRCGPGDVTLEVTTVPDVQYNWYDAMNGSNPLFSGNIFNTTLDQSATYFVTAGVNYLQSQHVGPVDNTIGAGANHAGNYYLIFDAITPFKLKTAKVYATGAGFRTFQVRDAADALLLEKSVFVPDGESRISLDLDIPQGVDLRIGCAGPADLYRNSNGTNYPYLLDGLMQIKGSTGGASYYYYLYDIEVESPAVCESNPVAVQALVEQPLEAPLLSATGGVILCPEASLELTANTDCPGCSVIWSNGETGASINVSNPGVYSAIVRNIGPSVCGDSPVSNEITLTTQALPNAPQVSLSSDTVLCPGETLTLSALFDCPDCAVVWSTGEAGAELVISAAGIYTAVTSNVCGDSPASAAVYVTEKPLPDAPGIIADGDTVLCPGESLLLTVQHSCPDCAIFWSTTELGETLSVQMAGAYVAIARNACGDSPASNTITVTENAIPEAPVLVANGDLTLCPGASVVLTAQHDCQDCSVFWSATETGPSLTVSAAGPYQAILQNVCGSSAGSNILIVSEISSPAAGPLVLALGDTVLCPGETLLLQAEQTCSGCTVVWSTADQGTSLSVQAAGVYTAVLQNACGDSPASNVITVTEKTLPDAPVVAASGPVELCAGASVALMAQDACSDCSILWSSGATSAQIVVDQTGIYSAVYSNSCGAGPASEAVVITVHPPFVPVVEVNDDCHLIAPAGSGYQWFINGIAIPGANEQQYTALDSAEYTVAMMGADGCSGASAPVLATACVSGVHQAPDLAGLRVFPNPASEQVFFEFRLLQAAEVQIELFAADGRLAAKLFLADLPAGTQQLKVTLPVLPTGVYRYNISTESGGVSGNLVLQR